MRSSSCQVSSTIEAARAKNGRVVATTVGGSCSSRRSRMAPWSPVGILGASTPGLLRPGLEALHGLQPRLDLRQPLHTFPDLPLPYLAPRLVVGWGGGQVSLVGGDL